MENTFPPALGRCRCDRVRFEIAAPPLLTMACHCTGCQRMSASAFSLSAAIPVNAFSVTQGEAVLGGLRGPTIRHSFCGYCMSWLFTRVEGMDSFVGVRVTMLDDPSRYPPYIETYTSERLSWVRTLAVRSFEQFPQLEEYEGLVRDYAAHVAASA